MDSSVGLLMDIPLWFRVKYLNNNRMNCREILYRHSRFLEDEVFVFGDHLSFPEAEPRGSYLVLSVRFQQSRIRFRSDINVPLRMR